MICTCMRMCMNASPQRPAAAFAVVYDLDGVVGAEGRGADAALLARSVHHCLRLRQPWAMCGANGQDAVGRYYDMWALRTTDEWMHAARASKLLTCSCIGLRVIKSLESLLNSSRPSLGWQVQKGWVRPKSQSCIPVSSARTWPCALRYAHCASKVLKVAGCKLCNGNYARLCRTDRTLGIGLVTPCAGAGES